MPLPLMLDHQETKIRTSKVLTKIRNGQVARFCAIGACANDHERPACRLRPIELAAPPLGCFMIR